MLDLPKDITYYFYARFTHAPIKKKKWTGVREDQVYTTLLGSEKR